jgi:bacteriocin-like protein
MEMTMSENKSIEKTRELTEDELDTVSGGAFPIVAAQMGLIRNCIEALENSLIDGSNTGPASCEIR